jgi:hypothetical protein
MLQDDFLPEYDFSEVHDILINQSPERIFSLMYDFDFTESKLIRFLFRLRGMKSGMTIKQGILEENFIELGYRQNDELVLGLVGQFWKVTGNLKKIEPSKFRHFGEPGFLKATWNFKLIPNGEQQTTLQTETRVYCIDRKAKTKFSRYWFFIRPFSGLIRKEILRLIKKKAELPVHESV